MRIRLTPSIVFGIIFVIILSPYGKALTAPTNSDNTSIPNSAFAVPNVIEKDGKQIEFNEKRDKVTVQSFFDVSWTDTLEESAPAESVNVTLSDRSMNETMMMNQNGETAVYAESNELLKFSTVDNATVIHIPTGLEGIDFISDASSNQHYVYVDEIASLRTDMVTGLLEYHYYGEGESRQILIQQCQQNGIWGICIIDPIASPKPIYLWSNNTFTYEDLNYDSFQIYILGFLNVSVMYQTITVSGLFFSVTLKTDTGVALVTLYTDINQSGIGDPIINAILSITMTNLWWAWDAGVVAITVFTMMGSMFITYYNTWWWTYYGLIYVFVWDIWDIKIEGFWYNWFYVVWNWYWVTWVWWTWECSFYWEFKCVIEEWVIEWTLFWRIGMTLNWDLQFIIYYCCWDLPFVVFEVPLTQIHPIVSIMPVAEYYNEITRELNLTYYLSDIYGKNINNQLVHVNVDGSVEVAEFLGGGMYQSHHTINYNADAWNIRVNATVYQVAIVQELDYLLNVVENVTECETCEECQECDATTENILIGTTIAGFSLVGLIALFGRKSAFFCPPN